MNDIQVCMYELKVFPEDSKHLIVGWLVGCCKNVKWKLKKIEKESETTIWRFFLFSLFNCISDICN